VPSVRNGAETRGRPRAGSFRKGSSSMAGMFWGTWGCRSSLKEACRCFSA